MAMFQLHVSGLNMLAKCGEQFRRRYIEGEKRPPGVALLIGTATDRAAEQDLRSKMQTGVLLPEEAVRDIARDTLMAEWEKGEIALDPEEGELDAQLAKAKAIDTSVAMASLYHREAAPGINPTHVQRPWTLDVKGLGFQMVGTIDVQEGSKSIRDCKTAAKTPPADEAHNSLQLTTYAMAARVIDGTIPEKLILDVCVKNKVPKLVQIESTRTAEDFSHLLARVEMAEKAMSTGTFTPAPLDAWWCAKKWCGYHSNCRYARKPVSVTVR